jgi:flavin-dependent dehydrogenase
MTMSGSSPDQPEFDVAIVGGGPAGSSLAARLARRSYRVALFERERFPREHIGESFASPVVPCLAETGALDPVTASSCWIRKFGGYYAWDHKAPSVSFFRHRQWQRDGVNRWSFHVNRAEFDAVLLEHARRCGAHVEDAAMVDAVETDGAQVRLQVNGRSVRCRLLVDASGRANRQSLQGRRGWLSTYRNIAVWGHFTGGLAAQSLPGDWNIFRDRNLSPIGCFAYPDGWCWYIPVPQTVDGRRLVTHSIGIVTDPSILKRSDGSLQDMRVFAETIRRVPLLKDLAANVRPLYSRLNVVTNYSMISGAMCDWDRRVISVGDASFFVDPLFSSGVSFAMLQAAAAAEVVDASLSGALAEGDIRELWGDYDDTWSTAAAAFATSIDQWYAAIAHENPDSVYWNERASNRAFHERMNSFDWLIDADPGGDLLFVITRGTDDIRQVAPDGPLTAALGRLSALEPAPDAHVSFAPEVTWKRSLTLQSSVFGGSGSALPSPWAHREYWSAPSQHVGEVASLFSSPRPCWRFECRNGTQPAVRSLDASPGDIQALLSQSPTFDSLRRAAQPAEWMLILRLLAAGMLEAAPRPATALH